MNFSGWKIIEFEELGSTNDKALEYSASAAKGSCTVIKAQRQTNGRGRRGHTWTGLDGNLFFSMLFEFDIAWAGRLSVISALSLGKCIKKLASEADVQFKWSNDVLLGGAKASGILLEKGSGDFIVDGIGVNIKHSPDGKDMPYPVTSLAEYGINVSADDFLRLYLDIFSEDMTILEKEGFEPLRRQWMQNARGLGGRVSVDSGKGAVKGIFEGIDGSGFMVLNTDGKKRVISAGDVIYE